MLNKITERYWNGSVILLNMGMDTVNCLGTAFLVSEDGWMLTSAHLVEHIDTLAVSPAPPRMEFNTTYSEKVKAIGVKKLRIDKKSDLALIAPLESIQIQLPPDMFGSGKEVEPGMEALYLGYSFGHMNLPILSARRGIISAKVTSRNGTEQLLMDNDPGFGMVGGPVISAANGRVVGIVTGGFNPFRELPESAGAVGKNLPPGVAPACATAIEAGLRLIEAESAARSAQAG